MTPQEIINQVCTALTDLNDSIAPVRYSHWISDNTGSATMCIDIYDPETGRITDEHYLRLEAVKDI